MDRKRNSRKRSNAHLYSSAGPSKKVFLGKNHEICTPNTRLNQPGTSTLKRSRVIDPNGPLGVAKLRKSDLSGDIESLRLSMEKMSNKENESQVEVKVLQSPRGARIWHIETFIEQNVYGE